MYYVEQKRGEQKPAEAWEQGEVIAHADNAAICPGGADAMGYDRLVGWTLISFTVHSPVNSN